MTWFTRAKSVTSGIATTPDGKWPRRIGWRRPIITFHMFRRRTNGACSIARSSGIWFRPAANTGWAFCHFFPLASGFLTGKYKRGAAMPEGSRLSAMKMLADRLVNDANFDTIEKLEEFANRANSRWSSWR